MRPLFEKICIVGMGLIGGSIGLAVRKRKLAAEVLGLARRQPTIDAARHLGAIDRGFSFPDMRIAIANADLVILCMPISINLDAIKKIRPLLKEGAIVIDVGSVKKEICDKATTILGAHRFVGCHPMAGKEKCGIASAEAELFEGSVCFVAARHPKINAFWRAIGSKPIALSADEHDRLVGAMSHTPHAIAFSLFQEKKDYPARLPVNPSMRELARLAKSNPGIWVDIFISNRAALLASIEKFEKTGIQPLKNFLRAVDRGGLERFIRKSNKMSQRLSL